jgi:hypothetical protein
MHNESGGKEKDAKMSPSFTSVGKNKEKKSYPSFSHLNLLYPPIMFGTPLITS